MEEEMHSNEVRTRLAWMRGWQRSGGRSTVNEEESGKNVV